ncbi:MAG: VWA domain-containing protein [Romboutsia sp.]
MENNELLRIRMEDLVENPTARVPVCLCLDISGSMDGEPIRELNEGIRLFYDAIKEDEIATYAAEISIVTFDSRAVCVEDFANIDRQENIPTLRAGGLTFMGEGVNLALDLLEKRKQEYQDKGVEYYQPWLVLMTDGAPNGNSIELNKAISRTNELVDNKKLTVFPIGIGNHADMSTLEKFSPRRQPLRLKGLNFKEFFEWLSQSVVKTSQSMPGESIQLDLEGLKGWVNLES